MGAVGTTVSDFAGQLLGTGLYNYTPFAKFWKKFEITKYEENRKRDGVRIIAIKNWAKSEYK